MIEIRAAVRGVKNLARSVLRGGKYENRRHFAEFERLATPLPNRTGDDSLLGGGEIARHAEQSRAPELSHQLFQDPVGPIGGLDENDR